MKHNKKRNVGIIYELLLKYISKKLVEGDNRSAKKATKILEQHFAKGTEIYKEYRLFNALCNSKISNSHTVASILNEAKNAARTHFDLDKLQKEKSSLLKSINYKLGKDFYYQKVKNYRSLGTVQMAINEWQKKQPDIKRLVEFETKIGEFMLSEKNISDSNFSAEASHTDKLVLKIMTEKFNKVYGTQLSDDQKQIIRNYVFCEGNEEKLSKFFNNKKNEALNILESFESETNNKYLLTKLDLVRNKIQNLSENNIDDQKVTMFLTLTKMINEIRKELNNV